jgi:hypothetical protein
MKNFISFVKKFAITIVVTICVGILAILYTGGVVFDYWFPTGDSLIVPKEPVSTDQKKTEVTNDAVMATTSPIKDKYVLELGSVQDNSGLMSFKIPTNWKQYKGSSYDTSPGSFTYITADYIDFQPTNYWDNPNSIKQGLRIDVLNEVEEVNSSIESPEAYRDFLLNVGKDSSNTTVSKATVDGVPAVLEVVKAGDYGGWVNYIGRYNGHKFTIRLWYTDSYENHAELFSKFISGVTFKSE